MTKLKKVWTAKTYRLKDNRSGETFTIKVGKKGNLIYTNEKEQVSRAIRHCPNQRSIFVDEQDNFALVETIVFRKGYLEVPAHRQITQEFLDHHPSNGLLFEEVNDEMEAKESMENEELVMDAKVAVRETSKDKNGIHKLKAVVSVLKGSVEQANKMGIEELKSVLYNEIEYDVSRFVDENGHVTMFEDDYILTKYQILRALREGVIRKSPNGKSILWSKDKTVIATAPRSIDVVEFFTEYLTTDDGLLVAEEITRRLTTKKTK